MEEMNKRKIEDTANTINNNNFQSAVQDKFAYADDSSDEEDNGLSSPGDLLSAQWNKFHKDRLPKFFEAIPGLTEFQIEKSFRVHFLGISLFHHPNVQTLYRKNKLAYLANNHLAISDDKIFELSKSAIASAINQIFSNKQWSDCTDNLIKKILDNKDIQASVEQASIWLKNKQNLLKGMNNPSFLKSNCEPLNKLQQQLTDFIKYIDITYFSSNPRSKISYNENYKNVNNLITKLLVKEIEEKIKLAEKLINDENIQGFFALYESWRKKAETLTGIDEVLFNILDSQEKEILSNITPLQEDDRLLEPEDLIESELYKDELLSEKFAELNLEEEDAMFELNSDTSLWKLYTDPYISSDVQQQISRYVTWTGPRIEQHITINLKDARFYQIIANQLLTIIGSNVHRSFINRGHIFKANNTLTFFANLRTISRSQTRMIRHIKSHQLPGGDVTVQNWLFDENIAYDQMHIKPTLSRSDFTSSIGDYPKIYETLEEIKSDLQLTDKDIALLIRNILNGKELKQFAPNCEKRDSYKSFMVNLTYLLFGSEVVRNPASFILHQMMLDLIIAEQSSWQEAFTGKDNKTGGGGIMPMSMKHAVSVSRWLYRMYDEHMPYHYYYEGNPIKFDIHGISSIQEFVNRQSLLMIKWYHYQNSLENNNQNTNEINTLILKMENDWYSEIYLNHNDEPNQAFRIDPM